MPVVTLTFRDNNGRLAEASLNFREDAPFPAVEAQTFTFAALSGALSDAVIIKAELRYTFRILTPGVPGPESNLERTAILIYRNGDDTSTIYLPSPAGLLFDTSGPYNGVRISRERLDLLGLLTSVQGLPAGTLDGVGRPSGTVFSVGGRTR